MRFRCAIFIALFLLCAVRSQTQALSESKFSIEIQKDEQERPTVTLTNLSEKILTACTIESSVSTEAGRPSEMNLDFLLSSRGPHGEPLEPLKPGESVTMNLPHMVGRPLPDKLKVVAGIWADGQTFGEQVWVKALVDHRASYVSAYEQAIALLKEGIENNWTREQYLAALDGKPQSLPFYSIRRTFQANQALDQRPQLAKNIAQRMLDHFEQDLERLHPQKAVEPVASASGHS
jgi:hypothetical protein